VQFDSAVKKLSLSLELSRAHVLQYEAMKRTTISLSDDLAGLVEREAARREMSISELVRLALTRLLRPEGGREIPWAGLVREPEMVYGADLDEALAEEWTAGDDSPGQGEATEGEVSQSRRGTTGAVAGDRR